MNLPDLQIKGNSLLNVVIETPAGCGSKYKYVESPGYFKLNKIMPPGFSFPFDFGFFPKTVGGDGDPLDALVLNDVPAYMGAVIECRLAGVIMSEQKDPGKNFVRNDRFIAIADCSKRFAGINEITDLDKKLVTATIDFFIHYNSVQGREFKVLEIKGSGDAKILLKKGFKGNT